MSATYEIEKKYLIKELPFPLESFPFHQIEQAYLCTEPVVRIRRQDNLYYLTYKGKGLMIREEYNLPLTAEAYQHLLPKADGNIISKKRYEIPFQPYIIELDIFDAPFAPLIMAEVEFPSEAEADSFVPPSWFDREVTTDPQYHNSNMSQQCIS